MAELTQEQMDDLVHVAMCREDGCKRHFKPALRAILAAYEERCREIERLKRLLSYGGQADIRECSHCGEPYPDFGVSSRTKCWDCHSEPPARAESAPPERTQKGP